MKRDKFPLGLYHNHKHDEPTMINYLIGARPRFVHSKPTLAKYDPNKYNQEMVFITKCPYCFNEFDGGDTRQFVGYDDMIHIACKPCLWKLGVRYCIHGDKIFGKGAS